MPEIIADSKSYQDLMSLLKNQIRTAQVRAAVAVNQELIQLYWGIGKEILDRQAGEGWGPNSRLCAHGICPTSCWTIR